MPLTTKVVSGFAPLAGTVQAGSGPIARAGCKMTRGIIAGTSYPNSLCVRRRYHQFTYGYTGDWSTSGTAERDRILSETDGVLGTRLSSVQNFDTSSVKLIIGGGLGLGSSPGSVIGPNQQVIPSFSFGTSSHVAILSYGIRSNPIVGDLNTLDFVRAGGGLIAIIDRNGLSDTASGVNDDQSEQFFQHAQNCGMTISLSGRGISTGELLTYTSISSWQPESESGRISGFKNIYISKQETGGFTGWTAYYVRQFPATGVTFSGSHPILTGPYGNVPASLSISARYNIYFSEGATVLATIDNPLAKVPRLDYTTALPGSWVETMPPTYPSIPFAVAAEEIGNGRVVYFIKSTLATGPLLYNAIHWVTRGVFNV